MEHKTIYAKFNRVIYILIYVYFFVDLPEIVIENIGHILDIKFKYKYNNIIL